jgi:hypothetical protein
MARYPGAIYRGPIPNKTVNGMVHPAHGLVLHIEQGSETGTDSWFHNPISRASAHFGVARDGTVHQWVDTNDKAWAEAAGNPYWYSVENEGYTGQSLTSPQIESIARLFLWLSQQDGFPLQIAGSISDKGLGHHGMGGLTWGGHYDCPGGPIVAQKQAIVDKAKQLSPQPVPPAPTPQPTGGQAIVNGANRAQGGYSLVGPDGGVFSYDDAPFHGSVPGLGIQINNAISMCWSKDGNGYYILDSNGGVYTFGPVPFKGSYFSLPASVRNDPNRRFVAIVARDAGYSIISSNNEHYDFI